jgi:hypothetical protein
MRKSQVLVGTVGVGPAESTGKSRIRYWPGGMRLATSGSTRRPRNPREKNSLPMMLILSVEERR